MQQIPYQGSGGLRVSVRTADGALPIADATVTIIDKASGRTLRTQTTDRSGNTEIISLPAPSAALSQTPGGGEVYAVYRLTVTADGYFEQVNESVPIFDGVLSLQNAALIPRAPYEGEDAMPDGDTVFDAGQTLEGGI